MDGDSFDLCILGAGPGGYVAAIRAAQFGKRVCLVDRGPFLGGTCLNVGCIPTKALLESTERLVQARDRAAEHGIVLAGPVTADLPAMMRRKEQVVRELTDGVAFLMRRNRVTVLFGEASLVAPDRVRIRVAPGAAGAAEPEASGEAVREVGARALLLATGSVPLALPFLPFDGHRVVDSTGALSFDRVPEHLVVIGAGAVGLELGTVWRRLGARVTVVERMPEVTPFADAQVARVLRRALEAQGVEFRLGTTVAAAEVRDEVVTLALDGGSAPSRRSRPAPGSPSTLVADRVLVAVGRRPATAGLGLDRVGLVPDQGGRIPVDDGFRTAVPGILAIGDLVRGPMLAHKASEEGVAVAELLSGRPGHVNYEAIPSIVYTDPELAMVGLTEEEARTRGHEVKVGRFLFKANGRARTLGEAEGMVKVVADARTDRLLGIHIVGPRASEIVAEAVVALEFQGSAEDLARTVHAHPTLSEAIKEAALAVDGRAIHA